MAKMTKTQLIDAIAEGTQLSKNDVKAVVEYMATVGYKELNESGEFIGGRALADPATSKVVRVRDGVPATTDGPFAESKEQLAGYYVLDVENIDRAVEIAARDPASRLWAIEVRPVMNEAGADM